MDTNQELALITATENEIATTANWEVERSRLLDELRQMDTDLLTARQVKRSSIVAARKNGVPVARISKLTKVTRQRIYQILREG